MIILWYADFENSKITDLWNLQSIWWRAYFGDSKITSLWNLQSIWWDIYWPQRIKDSFVDWKRVK